MSASTILDAHRQLCLLLTCSGNADTVKLRELFATSGESFWIGFAELADRSLVTPAVWSALEDSSLTISLPLSFREYFRTFFEWSLARNKAIQKELGRVVSALNDRSIIPVLLKGSAYISDQTYPNIGARALGDLDLLVAADQIGDAVEVVQSLGYAFAGPPGFGYDDHHHVEPLKNPTCQAYVEIHRQALIGSLSGILPAHRIISDSRILESSGAKFAVPSPTHSVMISILHSQIVNRCNATARVDIRRLMDLAQLNRRYRGSIEWNAIVEAMGESGFSAPLRNYLYTLEKLAGFEFAGQLGFSFRQRIHFALVNASLRYSWAEKLLSILDELSEEGLRERYAFEDPSMSVHSLRLRHLRSLLMRGLVRNVR